MKITAEMLERTLFEGITYLHSDGHRYLIAQPLEAPMQEQQARKMTEQEMTESFFFSPNNLSKHDMQVEDDSRKVNEQEYERKIMPEESARNARNIERVMKAQNKNEATRPKRNTKKRRALDKANRKKAKA